ncbi:hypothetical protein RIF29_14135 [Crotalaria pallida]|uniref:Uncharacterized protein n=1 Tax=Crotalaria pallida TaxID=3830 RepID=A0AAN9FB74_CROPI
MNNPNDNTRQLEENINFLNSLSNQLAESIHGIEGESGMERITASEVQTIKEILKKEDIAAAILRHFKTSSLSRSMDLPFAKETVGIVAMLASVENDAISRILSEYLGLANMLAIVCKTSKGVKSLEEWRDGEETRRVFFGSRNGVEVQFPLTPGLSDLPENLIEAEERLRQLQWEKTKVEADVKRELKLLDDLEGTSQGNDYLL